MGGGQALRIGLKNPDQFGWVGGFAPSLFGKDPAELWRDEEATRSLRLLWLSCGDQDHLLPFVQTMNEELTRREVPHDWHVGSGEHEWKVWQVDLREFAPKLFRSR
jgi:enterochelin esterase-like enzyme